MDGVLADFDRYYFEQFGIQIDRVTTPVDPPGFWDNIKGHGAFYRSLPPTPDCFELWEGVKKLHPHPIILSGIPWSMPEAIEHKHAWARQWLGKVHLITCESKDKRVFARAGDVLVDDWLMYSSRWTEMGGVFIHHTSAAESLSRLTQLFSLTSEGTHISQT